MEQNNITKEQGEQIKTIVDKIIDVIVEVTEKNK